MAQVTKWMETPRAQTFNDEVRQCIDNCLNCASVCEETIMYCLEQGGHHAEPSHIRRLMDCAEICRTSANYMLRGSEMHNKVCGVCADVCAACAEDCERFEGDEQMQACADACRKCSESCRQMASA